jgi:cell wall-associated NlpC family hydrolase
MIHTSTINGLQIQTGDILCLAFHGDSENHPVSYWRLLGLLIPGEVDHVAVYIGPQGRSVESAYRGVYEFNLGGDQWIPKKMYKYRGRFKDDFVGVAYPLRGRGLSEAEEDRIRASVAEFCLAQIDKPYNVNLLNPDREGAFYCSQLVYRAYLPHGIDLNTNHGVPQIIGSQRIIFPNEIWSGCPHQRADK